MYREFSRGLSIPPIQDRMYILDVALVSRKIDCSSHHVMPTPGLREIELHRPHLESQWPVTIGCLQSMADYFRVYWPIVLVLGYLALQVAPTSKYLSHCYRSSTEKPNNEIVLFLAQ